MSVLKRSLPTSNENCLPIENINQQQQKPILYRFRSPSRSSLELNNFDLNPSPTPSMYRSTSSLNFSFPKPPGVQLTREKERAELSVLNDRFADYVEKVRYLEAQNKKIQLDTNFLHDKQQETCQRIKSIFETEMTQIREVIESIFNEKSFIVNQVKEAQVI